MKGDADLDAVAVEQAALRRVATLVAEGATTAEVQEAVVREILEVLAVQGCSLDRYEPDGTTTTLAACGDVPFSVGGRWPLEPGTVAWKVLETRHAARVGNYADLPGTIAAVLREYPAPCIVGVPIVVDGRVWGMIGTGTKGPGEMPPDTETRLEAFTELVALAIANADAHDGLQRLVEEQRSLRRVATLVAGHATTAEVCAAVAEEAARALDAPSTTIDRYEPDGTSTVLAVWGSNPFRAGSVWPVEPGTVAHEVLKTRAPARKRIADYEFVPGAVSKAVRRENPAVTIVGVPIVADRRIWGVLCVASDRQGELPGDTEERLNAFTQLVATAISNADTHDRLRALVKEGAALRRVATLMAKNASTAEICATVVEEVAQVFEIPAVTLDRFEPDGTSTVLAVWGDTPFPLGSNWPVDPGSIADAVQSSGRSVQMRIQDYTTLTGAAADAIRGYYPNVSIVGVPIVLDGRVWGVMCAATKAAAGAEDEEQLPPGTERRLSAFTELVATTLSNADARESLQQLGAEQAALRRVADLVARGADSASVFDSVCAEAGALVGAGAVNLMRFTTDGFQLVAAGWSRDATHAPVGERLPLAPGTLAHVLRETLAPARMDHLEQAPPGIARFVRDGGFRFLVGTPVLVEGELWGGLVAANSDQAFPAASESRMARFTELVGIAISNAAANAQLISSRARLVRAGDEARRRIRRELEDTAESRLVALDRELQLAREPVPHELAEVHAGFGLVAQELASIVDDVRELAQGLHPSLLTRVGLGPSLAALADRSPIPVELKLELACPLQETIETAVYYFVSEALTNAAKHSGAAAITVVVTEGDGCVLAAVRDDGKGGAVADPGSGLSGLADRVEALGGTFALESPLGGGTRLAIELQTPAQGGRRVHGTEVVLAALPGSAASARLKRVAISCLLVDDSEAFLVSASRLLESQGAVVVGRASSGDEALTLARSLRPDVTLVDVELGAEDGVELVPRLLDENGSGAVILISSRDRDDLGEIADASGAAGFIPKQALGVDAIAELLGAQ